MKRRNFIQRSALTSVGLSFPINSMLSSCLSPIGHEKLVGFKQFAFDLLKDWCDGMIKLQIHDPTNPQFHGLIKCPACDVVHARLSDSVYPFFFLAKATGDQRYLDAGINAFEWSDRNVSQSDGSWTNDLDPKSWNGTTVFGAISLAETLHYHSDLLDEDRTKSWTERLGKAAEFIYKKFPTIDATNVNYGATNIYALNVIGRVLDEPKFLQQSAKLAEEVKNYFTYPNNLLFGEIKPTAHKLSKKGLPGVDLGYNVEESLNSLVMYAIEAEDTDLIKLLVKSLNSHLEFMLPDGGWDNSWGTRMFKWTYWGSRTCDGCQPAFGMMAGYNPAFGTAVIKNTELLNRCTKDGLLHGGPHYVSNGIKPCLHHTFTHAKSLAVILEQWDKMPAINSKSILPRSLADGVKYFEELDTAILSRGKWRATITAYDAEYYHKEDLRQATGISLSILYHNQIGLICTASLAVYKEMEPLNQQSAPGEDIALTPRVETFANGDWYTNLFDLEASFSTKENEDLIEVNGNVALKNENRQTVNNTAAQFTLNYQLLEGFVKIIANTEQEIKQETAFVLPIISPSGEKVNQPDPNTLTIQKPNGLLKITANVPLRVRPTKKDRTFNMVPGVEAIPIDIFFDPKERLVEIKVEVV